MVSNRWWVIGVCALWLGVSLPALAEDAAADAPADSRIGFTGANLFATADGTFHRWRVVGAELPSDDLTVGSVTIEIDIASLDTGIERRDEHLRSADFFGVDAWPTARVQVTGATLDGESSAGAPRYRAQFEITIRDVTRLEEGHFEVIGSEPLHVRGELELDRRDFGVGGGYSRWNPVAVRPEVQVTFEAVFPEASNAKGR